MMRVCGSRLWLWCTLAMELLPIALPSVSPGGLARQPRLPDTVLSHGVQWTRQPRLPVPAAAPASANARRPAAGASRGHLGLRGGSEDVAEQGAGQGALLPARVRAAALVAAACDPAGHLPLSATRPWDGESPSAVLL